MEKKILPIHQDERGDSVFFVVERPGQRVGYLCFSVPGLMLDQREIESANGTMDIENLDALFVMMIGNATARAKHYTSRLQKSGKKFHLSEKDKLGQMLFRGGGPDFQVLIDSIPDKLATLKICVDDEMLALCVTERLQNRQFFLVGMDGGLLSESHPLVLKVREKKHVSPGASYGNWLGDLEIAAPERTGRTRGVLASCDVRVAVLVGIVELSFGPRG